MAFCVTCCAYIDARTIGDERGETSCEICNVIESCLNQQYLYDLILYYDKILKSYKGIGSPDEFCQFAYTEFRRCHAFERLEEVRTLFAQGILKQE